MSLRNISQAIAPCAPPLVIALGTLFSGVAVATNAATLTATPIDSQYSSFTIEFTDGNNNNILDSGEVTIPLPAPAFSGMTSSNITYTKIDSIPQISGITGGFPIDIWLFSNLNSGNATGFPIETWTYEITRNEVVPEPLTILGTGLVAGFLPLLKRQKQQ
jgi:hypothetical protein